MKFRINKGILILIISVLIFSCGRGEKEFTDEEIEAASQELNTWFESEFHKDVEESPMMQTRLGLKTDYDKWDEVSHLKHAEDLKKAKKRLEYIKSVNPAKLDESTRPSYRLYKQQLEQEIEDYDFRFYNYPINQMFGYHSRIPAFLINMHRLDSVADAEAYIARLKGIPKLFEEVIANMKIREQNGIIPPKFVFDKVLDDSRNLIKGRPFGKSNEPNAILKDFKDKLDGLNLKATEKQELVSRTETALINDVKPAYDNLIAYLENQQKRATNDDGAWKFPKGAEFYNRALQRTTTTNMTAEEIHQLGLKEVYRIHGEMEQIMRETGFEGSLQDFFEFMRNDKQFYYPDTEEGRAAYLAEATEYIEVMKGRLDELFLRLPKADIVVKAVEPFREKSAGKAFYETPALDGSRPGTYYANLYDMKAMPKYQMEALAYHEGIPGHHMQLAIAQELEEIPNFRKFSTYQAYTEGWGLYSEFLPKEIGFYEDPYSDFGRLAMELWRSCRLVVDTGIHSKKWTREQGIDYYKQNTPNAESDAIKMVERHIVLPGQATAYKVGMNKILELRSLAQNELEEDFDLREFHDLLLKDGAMPLSILEERVKNWIEEKN
ncbi:DUF885 domain-containing protein [Salegentibacter sp. HM20]